jgi:hypothetical protein
MMQSVTISPEPQRLRALERANEVRLARAEMKRRIADGEVRVADVILDCPREVSSWPVADLLMSQRGWGSARCRKFLTRNDVSEIKRIGTLTERQRRVLAAQLHPGRDRYVPHSWIPIGTGLAPAKKKNHTTNPASVSPALTTSTPSSTM